MAGRVDGRGGQGAQRVGLPGRRPGRHGEDLEVCLFVLGDEQADVAPRVFAAVGKQERRLLGQLRDLLAGDVPAEQAQEDQRLYLGLERQALVLSGADLHRLLEIVLGRAQRRHGHRHEGPQLFLRRTRRQPGLGHAAAQPGLLLQPVRFRAAAGRVRVEMQRAQPEGEHLDEDRLVVGARPRESVVARGAGRGEQLRVGHVG